MEAAFYGVGIFFFIFAASMLAGMNISIGQIAKRMAQIAKRMTDEGRQQ